jgi:hypothetical protein
MKVPSFSIGDRVAMSPAFLQSIFDRSRESRAQRGFVTHVSPVHLDRMLVQVQWDDGHVSKSLNVNLAHADDCGMAEERRKHP